MSQPQIDAVFKATTKRRLVKNDEQEIADAYSEAFQSDEYSVDHFKLEETEADAAQE